MSQARPLGQKDSNRLPLPHSSRSKKTIHSIDQKTLSVVKSLIDHEKHFYQGHYSSAMAGKKQHETRVAKKAASCCDSHRDIILHQRKRSMAQPMMPLGRKRTPRSLPSDGSSTPSLIPNNDACRSQPDIFAIWNSPVLNLNDDTLREVFSFCNTAETLSVVGRVCRRWRSLVSDPWMWRTLYYEWTPFIHLLHTLSRHAWPPWITHVRSLMVTNSPLTKLTMKTRDFPFRSLKSVHTQSIYLDDLIELVVWLDALEELRCDSIRQRYKTSSVVLSMFSKLQRLKVLTLHFEESCKHLGYTSELSGVRPSLAPTLKELAISNLSDIEERQISVESRLLMDPDMDVSRWSHPWNMMEHTMLSKYKAFSLLGSLRSLSLGDCRAFTARVWRECLLPCAGHLETLSLAQWDGCGFSESPAAHQRRQQTADTLHVPINQVTQEVETALSDFLCQLERLTLLRLDQFYCDQGVMRGIGALSQLDPQIQSSHKWLQGKTAQTCRGRRLMDAKWKCRSI